MSLPRPGWLARPRLVQGDHRTGLRRHNPHLARLGLWPEGAPKGTLLCVHGNPELVHLWRRLVAAPPAGWRVIAIDHLDMGFSNDRHRATARTARR